VRQRSRHCFRTDANGALIDASGRSSTFLFTLGPPRCGDLFETTAVPEIRTQAKPWRSICSPELGLLSAGLPRTEGAQLLLRLILGEQTFHGRDELFFIAFVERAAARLGSRRGLISPAHRVPRRTWSAMRPSPAPASIFFRGAGLAAEKHRVFDAVLLDERAQPGGFCSCSASSNESATISSPWL